MPTRKTPSKSKSTKKTAPKRAATKTTSTKRATAKKKATATKKAPAKRKKKKSAAVSDSEVSIDRRRKARRDEEGTESTAKTAEPKLERRQKVARRRQIDPTTCERDYSDNEVEFMNALDDYKRKNGRMFPTCSEVLEVIRGLGYVQLTPAELAARGGTDSTDSADTDFVDETQGDETLQNEDDAFDEAELEAEIVG